MIAFIKMYQENPRVEVTIRADSVVSWRAEGHYGGTLVEYHVGAEARGVIVCQTVAEVEQLLLRAMETVDGEAR